MEAGCTGLQSLGILRSNPDPVTGQLCDLHLVILKFLT